MSHIVTRLFADHLKHPDFGVAAIVAMMSPILYPGDTLPDVSSLLIGDETRDEWVTKLVPDSDPIITLPAIRVVTMDHSEDAGVPRVQSTDAHTLAPTIRVAAQIILRGDGKEVLSDAMYLLRALRASWAVWDDPAILTLNSKYGVTVFPTQGRSTGQLKAPLGDNMVSPGAVMGSIPHFEIVPTPLIS